MAFIEGAWLTEGRWVGYAVLLVCAYKVRVSPRLGLFSGVALWATSDQPFSRPPTPSLVLSFVWLWGHFVCLAGA